MNIRKSMARPAVCAAAFMAAACMTATALAQERVGAADKVMTVRYNDLNISTTSGATTLYNRIVGAARSVCGEEGYEVGIDAQRYWNSCFHTAVDDAVAKVHSPVLTQIARHQQATAAPVTAMLGQ
jgi:UrcA family protein